MAATWAARTFTTVATMAQAFQRGATLSQRCGGAAPRRHRSTLRRAASSVSGLGDLVDDYDVFLLDQYGVLHNGAALFPAARDALAKLHAADKRLVVLSNTSKRRQALVDELPGRGFDAAWLAGAVCSGEACHGGIFGPLPGRVWVSVDYAVPRWDGGPKAGPKAARGGAI